MCFIYVLATVTGFMGATSLPQEAATSANNDNTPYVFGSINSKPWFISNGVQDQLNLNNEQLATMKANYLKHYTVYTRSIAPNSSNASGVSPEEQRKIAMRARYQFYKDFLASANGVMDEKQRTRLNQLTMQYRGYEAFYDITDVDLLKLSNDQFERLVKHEEEYHRQLAIYYKSDRSDRDDAKKRFEAIREDMQQRIDNVLNDEQRKVWKQLIGESFKFTSE